MSFKLTLDAAPVDLFPDFTVEYSIDVYSVLNPDEVKSPVSFSNRFPYTPTNISTIVYDFDADKSNYPILGKAYELTDGSGNIISSGTAYLSTVVVNSDEPYFELRFEDKATELIKEFEGLDWSDLYDDDFSTTVNILDTYLSSNQNYSTRDVELAYIDVCNDHEKFRYEARQFTGWGLTGKKVGLFPTINVINFIDRLFTAANETSQSNFLSNLSTWKAANLYALVPARLMRNASGQRSQTITPYTHGIFINEDLATGAIPSTYAFGVYQNTAQNVWQEDPGTNYNVTDTSGTLTYGGFYQSSDSPTNIVDPQTDETRLGYVAWSSGFDGNLSLTSNGTIVDFKLAIPAIEYEYDPDKWGGLLIDEFVDVSNAEFFPRAIIYRSGIPVLELPVLDINGDPLSLTPSLFENGEAIDQDHNGFGHNHANAIVFEPVNVFLDYPIEILSTSQYSIKYKIEIVGSIEAVVVDDNDNVVSANYVFEAEEIAKARVYGYDPADLRVTISTAGEYVATAPTDQFTFQYSLQSSATKKPHELFSEILSRFGLSLIYDYSSSTFILDTLNDVRRTSIGFPIDDYIDNLQPYEVSGGQEKYAFFRLLNEINDGLYDKRSDNLAYGSFDGVVGTGGQGKYSVQFNSALINRDKKTICGDIAELPDQAIQKLLPSQEVGIINNEIPDYTDVGVRFFYLRSHQFTTTIRYPQYLDVNQYGQVVQSLAYKPMGPYFLGGYPINENGDGLNLEFGTETTLDDFFTYYTNLDKIQAASRTKMKFNAAVPVSWITNLSFFKEYFYFASPNENFVIDSVQGQIYDNYFYGEFTVRFL